MISVSKSKPSLLPTKGSSAKEQTDKAIAFVERHQGQRWFLWVHYYDPHYPYEPPEPFRSQHKKQPYLGEVAFMDQEMGRLIEAFLLDARQQVVNPLVKPGRQPILGGDHVDAVFHDRVHEGLAVLRGLDRRIALDEVAALGIVARVHGL